MANKDWSIVLALFAFTTFHVSKNTMHVTFVKILIMNSKMISVSEPPTNYGLFEHLMKKWSCKEPGVMNSVYTVSYVKPPVSSYAVHARPITSRVINSSHDTWLPRSVDAYQWKATKSLLFSQPWTEYRTFEPMTTPKQCYLFYCKGEECKPLTQTLSLYSHSFVFFSFVHFTACINLYCLQLTSHPPPPLLLLATSNGLPLSYPYNGENKMRIWCLSWLGALGNLLGSPIGCAPPPHRKTGTFEGLSACMCVEIHPICQPRKFRDRVECTAAHVLICILHGYRE